MSDTNAPGAGEYAQRTEREVQVGWRSRTSGVMCDCPVYERSPHADSDPVMVPREVANRIQTMHLPREVTDA